VEGKSPSRGVNQNEKKALGTLGMEKPLLGMRRNQEIPRERVINLQKCSWRRGGRSKSRKRPLFKKEKSVDTPDKEGEKKDA